MATTPQTDKAPPGKPSNKPKIPPEERFWKRYSPHHEFLLSSTGSGVLHAVAFAVLFFGALLAAMLGIKFDNNVEVDAMVIAGGGGSPSGAEGPTTGIGKKEDTADLRKSETEKMKPPQAPPEGLEVVRPTDPELMPDQPAARLIEDDIGMGKNLNAQSEAARQRLADSLRGNVSKGRGGSGEGGGQGKGKGPGVGDLSGQGRINVTKREQRQLRWTMIFNTRDGDDYVRQLQALKAILAIPGSGRDEYLVIDDLRKRPAEPRPKDIQEINRIYWIDDRPDSVMSLSRALQLSPVPERIVAFFPQELEQELLKKELRYGHLPEERIGETRFQVQRRGASYEPVVVYQTRRR
jgi:hypothetical protein